MSLLLRDRPGRRPGGPKTKNLDKGSWNEAFPLCLGHLERDRGQDCGKEGGKAGRAEPIWLVDEMVWDRQRGGSPGGLVNISIFFLDCSLFRRSERIEWAPKETGARCGKHMSMAAWQHQAGPSRSCPEWLGRKEGLSSSHLPNTAPQASQDVITVGATARGHGTNGMGL